MTKKFIALFSLLAILTAVLCGCEFGKAPMPVQTVEGIISNISETHFLIIDKSTEKPTLIAQVNLRSFWDEKDNFEIRSFEETIATEYFANSRDDKLSFFTVNGEPFYNGDKVSLEYIEKLGRSLVTVSKITLLETPPEKTERAFLEKLYNAGQQYLAQEMYSEAALCFERIGVYKDAQEKATEAHNADMDRIKDTDLAKMQGTWHSIEYCAESKYAECDFFEIKGTAIANRPHSFEPSYKNWFTVEVEGDQIKIEWEITEEIGGEVTKRETEIWTLYFEDDHLVNLIHYQDGTETKTVYYRTTTEIGSYYTPNSTPSKGGTCAKAGCSKNAVTTGDSVYCATHSNRCLNCSCYIDGDAMYCMSCIRSALR